MNTNLPKSIRQITAACFVLLALSAVSPKLSAAIITVTSTADSGPGSLRAALASAANGDTINFSLPTPSKITLTSGELLVAKSVNILGPGTSNLTVDGNDASAVFHIAPSNTTTISGLTITNGYATYFPYAVGVHNDHSTLTISNCQCAVSGIYNNARNGSGGPSGSANLRIENSILNSNGDWAIFSFGQAGSLAQAGTATVQIVSSTISGNAGGILNIGGPQGSATLTVVNSTLSSTYNNPAIQSGGNAQAMIANSTLNGNLGHGVLNQNGAVMEIVNSTLTDNDFGPGTSILNGATLRIVNSTIAGLKSPSQTVIFNGNGASLEIGSSIVDSPSLFGSSIENTGTFISLGYNLSSDDGGGFLTNATDLINTDPRLGPLQDNGGPTLTHALTCRSLAVDHGKNFSGSLADQRGAGFIRSFDDPTVANPVGGDGADIGAFEAREPLPICDLAPVADASPTTVSVISSNKTSAAVNLDGSRSSDPDGDALQYDWFENGNLIASGEVAVTVLPVGNHDILLIVSDGTLSDTNGVTIEVITAADAVTRLGSELTSNLSHVRPLAATLRAALASLDRNNLTSAANQLQAFQHKVRAQVAPVDPALAGSLIQSAQAILDAINSANPGK